jgi:ribosomal-protein-alanine N-acetyltransferase
VIEIQSASAAAATALAEIHRVSFDPAWSAAELALLIDGHGAICLTACRDNDPAGFILARAVADEAEVLTIATLPHHRRHGVASALLDAARVSARELGAMTLFLEVATDNPGAISLYTAHGFRQVGLRPRYYSRPGGDVSGLIMQVDLNR